MLHSGGAGRTATRTGRAMVSCTVLKHVHIAIWAPGAGRVGGLLIYRSPLQSSDSTDCSAKQGNRDAVSRCERWGQAYYGASYASRLAMATRTARYFMLAICTARYFMLAVRALLSKQLHREPGKQGPTSAKLCLLTAPGYAVSDRFCYLDPSLCACTLFLLPRAECHFMLGRMLRFSAAI